MRTKLKKELCVALILGLLIGIIPSMQVFAGGRTPNDDWVRPYIVISTSSDDSTYIYSEEPLFKTGKVKGISYDKKKKVLTIKNYKNPKAELKFNSMGEDIKIKVVGKNTLGQIYAKGHKTGSVLTITGTGTLELNKDRSLSGSIYIDAEEEKGALIIDKQVTLKAYAGSFGCVFVDSTTVSNEKDVIRLKSKKKINNIEKQKFYHVVREPYWLHMTYEDGSDEWIAASAWVANKKEDDGDDSKYLAYQMQNGDWCVFKDIDVIFNGYPEAEFFINEHNGQDSLFNFSADGYRYGYLQKDDLIVKGKK